MPGRRYLFDRPDRFAAGTIGEPGNRTFFLQARDGGRIVSVSLEKVQVAALAQRLDEIIDELVRQGVAEAIDESALPRDTGPLDEPLNEAFRATTLTLGWDGSRDRLLVEARTGGEDEEEEVGEEAAPAVAAAEDEDADLLRVHLTPLEARTFVERAVRVLGGGRPPCPLCGQPLDPQGHLCPRRNGHRLN